MNPQNSDSVKAQINTMKFARDMKNKPMNVDIIAYQSDQVKMTNQTYDKYEEIIDRIVKF